jgi:hypothetical protein
MKLLLRNDTENENSQQELAEITNQLEPISLATIVEKQVAELTSSAKQSEPHIFKTMRLKERQDSGERKQESNYHRIRVKKIIHL